MIDLTSESGRKVKRRLQHEYFIWLTSVDAGLTPQPRPVWFIWDRDSFLIYSQAQAHKVQQIRSHPNVALHFNTDETADQNVTVFLGRAVLDSSAPPAHQMAAYLEKYREGVQSLGMTPEEFGREYSVAIRVTPTRLRGW